MSRDEIPRHVRDFIARNLTAVEELDVLLLLRAVPDKDWTLEDVRRALTTSVESAELRAEHLVRAGLVRRSEEGSSYRYAPRDSETARTIDDLAEAYAKRRVSVIGLIFAGPSDSVRSFSDAFRLREED